MPKFDREPSLNNPINEINPAELPADVNADKKPEIELTPEELEKLKTGQGPEQKRTIEQPELSPEEQLKNLEDKMESQQREMTRLTVSIERTKAQLNEGAKNLAFL